MSTHHHCKLVVLKKESEFQCTAKLRHANVSSKKCHEKLAFKTATVCDLRVDANISKQTVTFFQVTILLLLDLSQAPTPIKVEPTTVRSLRPHTTQFAKILSALNQGYK